MCIRSRPWWSVAEVPAESGPARVVSIDLVRGLDVLLMLFVNEMAGVRGTPGFLLHMPASADGMTLTDTVFPAFLFITGMAIPLALRGRLAREPRGAVWRYVLARGASLLAIGVLMVNAERARDDGLVPAPLWNILMTLTVLLVWSAPDSSAPRRRAVFHAIGLVLILA